MTADSVEELEWRANEILKQSSETKRMANIINLLVNGSASTFNQQTNASYRAIGNPFCFLSAISLCTASVNKLEISLTE